MLSGPFAEACHEISPLIRGRFAKLGSPQEHSYQDNNFDVPHPIEIEYFRMEIIYSAARLRCDPESRLRQTAPTKKIDGHIERPKYSKELFGDRPPQRPAQK
ncbi:hypothetical protein [Herbaspirillum sp. alder98]|uniref:hypothetical protein n=1 Tax=Herbaspirillum sp. alder98 TaxID=2913096 RepID=UPI001CD8EE37|nr:hypothetical protein [Herbaspirillum sp. alder98]MCA1326176.1 hypothetical protein [Herbaspirillum sp. alder98]